MNSYKVEITRTETFVFDVRAESEEKAIDLAHVDRVAAENAGILHYNQTGDTVFEEMTYDVTGTDDDFVK